MKTLAVLFLGAMSSLAQEGKVVQLSPADATAAREAYAAMRSAQKKWEAIRKNAVNNYLKDLDWYHHNTEFEFSDDFRFIVPKNYFGGGSASSGIITIQPQTPCITTLPAISPCQPLTTTCAPYTFSN
jgi:hypothetical protein